MKAMMFQCSMHPNARENGVYLRWFEVRRTRDDGSENPRYEALKAHNAGLAARTYHGDTFRAAYVSQLRTALHDSLARGERCPIGDNLPPNELAAFEQRLLDGAVDLGFPVN